ncbi:hypothetical protein PF005_g6427 [Phytophthora fragariae]|uniref:DUF7769 domain-containing protein n=1 Tax=Phytophthora fragariae TaxID=53985 RepID=A0A6A3UFJ3_9STRA|nr:hypothetical protein PF003_g38187 [Phytophthora fragariae]KAE8943328.1 hypothetical protein PF009_g6947 [Phytophthora fragariae]KAE9019507.1 hypothetical protein PF011_g5802 [Phytophthora fragariae]KAE9124930.1 hypothetical protein PF007_g6542 [Phytophthora fragariae]KAE9125972.1 hypothetical protein PF010_g5429 [Phytophthora fragariae]
MAKPTTTRKPKLTDIERQQVFALLLLRSTNGCLKHGVLAAVARAEGIHPSTISRLWIRAKAEAVRTSQFASPSRRRRSGRRPADHTATLD